MPRQNEQVNEIWICDKGRFAHHYAQSNDRVTSPRVRKNGKWVKASWGDALDQVAQGLKGAGSNVLAIASGRASNEDLFNLHSLMKHLGGKSVLSDQMAGGNLVQRYGVGAGTNLGDLGKRDAVLVIASDLHEEAPIWWLRLKQAAERGATLVVANARATRLDAYAKHKLEYSAGEAVQAALGLLYHIGGDKDLARFEGGKDLKSAAKALKRARNLMVFYGQEGVNYSGTESLARAGALMVESKGRVGEASNGLVAVWPNANTQGAWDMGFKPDPQGVANALDGLKAAYVVASDPISSDPESSAVLEGLAFLVVQDLFMTPTAEMADVVLPAQSFVERAGTFTSGERRVQRLYAAVAELSDSLPDWKITAEIAKRLEIDLEAAAAPLVFERISEQVRDYSGLSYSGLARVEPQWPVLGGSDLYFGGTAYMNGQGLGIQIAPRGEGRPLKWKAPPRASAAKDLLLVPVTRLYDRSTTMQPSNLLGGRIAALQMSIHPSEIERLGLGEVQQVEVSWDGRVERLELALNADVPPGLALVPRRAGLSIAEPIPVDVRRPE